MKIAVLSDIHGNRIALEAVLEELKEQNIEECIILGDFIGYYYRAREVLDSLKNADLNISCVRGNHEHMVEMVLNGNIMLDDVNRKYGHGLELAMDQIGATMMTELVSLPDRKIIDLGGQRILLSHGAPDNPAKYVYPDADFSELHLDDIQVDFLLMGHTHYPMVKCWENITIVNPGSVGQARNRGGYANWCIINTDNGVVTMQSTPYQIEKVVAECRKYDPGVIYLQSVLER